MASQKSLHARLWFGKFCSIKRNLRSVNANSLTNDSNVTSWHFLKTRKKASPLPISLICTFVSFEESLNCNDFYFQGLDWFLVIESLRSAIE